MYLGISGYFRISSVVTCLGISEWEQILPCKEDPIGEHFSYSKGKKQSAIGFRKGVYADIPRHIEKCGDNNVFGLSVCFPAHRAPSERVVSK